MLASWLAAEAMVDPAVARLPRLDTSLIVTIVFPLAAAKALIPLPLADASLVVRRYCLNVLHHRLDGRARLVAVAVHYVLSASVSLCPLSLVAHLRADRGRKENWRTLTSSL